MFRLRTYQKRFRKASSFNAYSALSGKANGFVLDVLNDTVLVKDTTTAANNFIGTMAEALSAGILVYSSPSTKYVTDSFGVLQSGTSLRSNHNSSGTSLGLLSEPQRTNLILRSQELATSPWAISGTSSVSNNADVAPDGTTTASLLTVNAVESSGRYQTITVAENTAYAYSQWVKLGTLPLSEYRLAFYNSTAASWISLNAAYTGTPTSSGWTRIHYVVTTPAGCTSLRVYPQRTPAGAASGGTLLVWGAQLEAGLFPTSYIKTEASAVTRAADNLYVDLAKVPFGAEYTVIAHAQPSPDSATNAHVIYTVGDNTVNERHRVSNGAPSGANLSSIWRTGNVVQAELSATGAPAATAFKVATATKADDFEFVVNGTSRGTDTSGTIPTSPTRLQIGASYTAILPWAAPIGFLALIPERLSQADLIARTT